MTHVQGHEVKYSNRNNSAADCSVSLKFGTETDDTSERFRSKVKGQGHSVTERISSKTL